MGRKRPALPRNPLVAKAMFRKAGAHDKTRKAKRRGEKVMWQRECGVAVAQQAFTLPGSGSNPGAPTTDLMKSVLMRTSKQGAGA